MPIDYKKYPDNWKTEIRPRILKRDENKCKFCGIRNYTIGWRDDTGKFEECNPLYISEFLPSDRKEIKIILTVAHLDHKLDDHSDENLAALCQKCHLDYDIEQNNINRIKNKDDRTGQVNMF